MEAGGDTEQWITVYEFRTYFHLDESSAHAISGFLRRIYQAPFFSFRYRVKKIERIIVHTPQRRSINRYLVKKRVETRNEQAAPHWLVHDHTGVNATISTGSGNQKLCTDYDAVTIFNKVLHQGTRK
jgi:hypothetical protein